MTVVLASIEQCFSYPYAYDAFLKSTWKNGIRKDHFGTKTFEIHADDSSSEGSWKIYIIKNDEF